MRACCKLHTITAEMQQMKSCCDIVYTVRHICRIGQWAATRVAVTKTAQLLADGARFASYSHPAPHTRARAHARILRFKETEEAYKEQDPKLYKSVNHLSPTSCAHRRHTAPLIRALHPG